MNNGNQESTTTKENHWFNLMMIVIYTLIGMFVAQFIGLILILPFFGFDLTTAMLKLTDTSTADARLPLLIVQGVTAMGAFVIAPYLFLRRYKPYGVGKLISVDKEILLPVILVFGITISFMFVNSLFIEWNKGIDFPDFMSAFEEYAKEQESNLEKLTIYLTTFDNTFQFILGILIISVIPAFGEELLFRGVIQNELQLATKNIHLAIWLSAFAFGLFHFQFYGLVPRMLLGVLFGYLYYWSGSLLYAIIGHFINNGFTLVMLYLFQLGIIDYDIQATESTPLSTVIIFFIIGTVLSIIFIRYNQNRTTAILNE